MQRLAKSRRRLFKACRAVAENLEQRLQLAANPTDLESLYVFRSPANANNTVLILTASPFAGVQTPATFDTSASFDFKIDTTGDFKEDITYSATFGAPDINGVQQYTIRRRTTDAGQIIASGLTGQNVPVFGGGMARAGLQ